MQPNRASSKRSRLFWAVSLGHMTNDIFMSMGGVLLAFMASAVLPMSNAQIGFAVSLTQLTGAISQPFFGLLADRTGGRLLGAGGVTWVVSMMMLALSLASGTGNYWLMLIPFALMGLGSGAFHPVGSLHAAESDKTRVASNMSVFFLFGQFGLGLGPAVAGALLDGAATHFNGVFLAGSYDGLLREQGTLLPIFFMPLVALLPVLLMLLAIPGAAKHRATRAAHTVSAGGISKKALPLGAFAIFALLVLLRAPAQPGSVNFIPRLFQEKGWTPAEYGLITSSFWLASGLAGVLFGVLADRFDRRRIITVGLLLSAPAYFLLPLETTAFAFVLAVLAGGLSGGSHSLLVVIAQELLPVSKGFASGAALGLIFGAGAFGSLLIGGMADNPAIGLNMAFQLVAGLLVLAAGVALLLPGRRSTIDAPPQVEPELRPAGPAGEIAVSAGD